MEGGGLTAGELFDAAALGRLERLAIVARRTFRGVGKGERRGERRGGSVEFADYRSYAPGDDTRSIDWHAYARFEDLFVKLFVEEQELSVHLLLDCSASMAQGEPQKHLFALRAAAALAYIVLGNGDRLSLYAAAGGGARHLLGPTRGRRAFARVLGVLGALAAGGETRLADSVRAFSGRHATPGVLLLLSDLLDEDGPEAIVRRLRSLPHEAMVLHILSPEELSPGVGGDLHLLLVDSETGAEVEVTLDRTAERLYLARLAAFLEGAAAACRQRGVGYARARTDIPFDALVLDVLRGGGLVA